MAITTRSEGSLDKQRYWTRQWGRPYSPAFKRMELSPLTEEMEGKGLLGERMLDVGSGSMPKDGPPYPTKGKRIVRMDIGAPFQFRLAGGILDLQIDIEAFSPLSRKGIIAADHLGRRSLSGAFSAIFFIDVLNYVDSEKSIGFFLDMLERGGRMIISNFANMGLLERLSIMRPSTNRALVEQITGKGMSIEHLSHPPLYPPWMPGAPEYRRSGYPSLMPVRDIGSMILVAAKC